MDKIFGDLQFSVLLFSMKVIVMKIWRLKTPQQLSECSLLHLDTRTIMGSQTGGPKRI